MNAKQWNEKHLEQIRTITIFIFLVFSIFLSFSLEHAFAVEILFSCNFYVFVHTTNNKNCEKRFEFSQTEMSRAQDQGDEWKETGKNKMRTRQKKTKWKTYLFATRQRNTRQWNDKKKTIFAFMAFTMLRWKYIAFICDNARRWCARWNH